MPKGCNLTVGPWLHVPIASHGCLRQLQMRSSRIVIRMMATPD